MISFSNNNNLPPFKSVAGNVKLRAMVSDPSHGAIFSSGGSDCGRDLSISDNAGNSTASFSDFGHKYTLPEGYIVSSPQARSLMAGNFNFTPTEEEVFY